MNRLTAILVLFLSIALQAPAHGWDSVGHRLSTAVALEYMSPARQALLLQLLQQHPRFEADFRAAMPVAIQRGSEQEQLHWLLGQAAYWPDLARGLPDAAAARFNRPAWHYTDGAWVRDNATGQGNIYIGIAPFADIDGEPAAAVRTEAQVHNIMTALDYNSRILADTSRSGADRAVALCWVLHLVGDIHQPLHAGSLYSARLFRQGDRGGNGISTDAGNLHARWDRALADSGIAANLARILAEPDQDSAARITGVASDWSQWLAESRELLLTEVYNDPIRAAVARADQQGGTLPTQRLDSAYVANMQRLARQRLGLAGLRIAIWVENTL